MDNQAEAGRREGAMDNPTDAAKVRRARLASYLTAAVLILGGGSAIAAGATGHVRTNAGGATAGRAQTPRSGRPEPLPPAARPAARHLLIVNSAR